ncbi:MAG: V-type ATP synthase subunit D [Candidatus Pacebacteria bacterium]|nr:V-type ATP synthase subunit D [Candidatus Paceibacterota bacterium]
MESIKATRMEYLHLKRQLKTAQHGHKLLKDKRDGLMKRFMELIRQTKSQRKVLEEKLADSFKRFVLTTAFLHQKELEEIFLAPSAKVLVAVEQENVMSVWIPKFQHKIEGDFKTYSDFSAPLGLRSVLLSFWDSLELMLQLAAQEHSARLLSFEIEKTRRRVNALEYVIIPQVKRKIKYISSKLDEHERSEKIIRMKIKALLES